MKSRGKEVMEGVAGQLCPNQESLFLGLSFHTLSQVSRRGLPYFWLRPGTGETGLWVATPSPGLGQASGMDHHTGFDLGPDSLLTGASRGQSDLAHQPKRMCLLWARSQAGRGKKPWWPSPAPTVREHRGAWGRGLS